MLPVRAACGAHGDCRRPLRRTVGWGSARTRFGFFGPVRPSFPNSRRVRRTRRRSPFFDLKKDHLSARVEGDSRGPLCGPDEFLLTLGFFWAPVHMLMRNSLVNVGSAERTTTKNRKSFDTGGRTPRDFSNRTVRKGVSFWCAFGVPSRAVRLVSWGRTVLFENGLAPHHNPFAQLNTTNTRRRRNCLPAQPFTSESPPTKKRLHPTADRQGAESRCFALSRNRSTPRTEEMFHRFCNPSRASSSSTPPPSLLRSRS